MKARSGTGKIPGFVSLLMAYFLVQILRNSPSAVKLYLDAEFGLSTLQYSNLSSAFFYSYALVQIPAGILVDVTGPRKTALGGTALMAAGSILHGLSNGYRMLFFSRMMMGMGSGVMFLCVLKYLALQFRENQFSTLTGFSSAVANIGAAVSQAPVVALAAGITWRRCFYLFGGIVLISVLLISIFVSEGKQGGPEHRQTFPEVMKGIRGILLNRHMYVPFLINFIAQGIYVVGFTWTISYLCDVYGVSTMQAGSVSSVVPIVATVVTFSSGRVCDMQGRRKPAGVVCSLMIVLMLGLAAFFGTEKPPYFLAAVSVMSSGVAVFYAIYFGLAKDLNPPEFSGIATGLLNMTTFIGASTFPIIFGAVLDRFGRNAYGYRMAYRLVFVIALIMLILCMKAKETGMRNRWQDIRDGTF